MFAVGTPVRVITKKYGEDQTGLTGKVERVLNKEYSRFDCGVRLDDNQGPFYSNYFLYFDWEHLQPLTLKYDPMQQGDKDDDI